MQEDELFEEQYENGSEHELTSRLEPFNFVSFSLKGGRKPTKICC